MYLREGLGIGYEVTHLDCQKGFQSRALQGKFGRLVEPPLFCTVCDRYAFWRDKGVEIYSCELLLTDTGNGLNPPELCPALVWVPEAILSFKFKQQRLR